MRIAFTIVAWLSVRTLSTCACRPRHLLCSGSVTAWTALLTASCSRAAMREIVGLPGLLRRRAVEASGRRPRPAGVAGTAKFSSSTAPTRRPGLCECGSGASAYRGGKGSQGILSA